jgi:transposase-like protein
MKSLSYPNAQCFPSGKAAAGRIIRYGFYKTRWGNRRRYQCQICGKTFCSATATPYHRLQHRRATFDEVAALSVEVLNKSAIARVKRVCWNTVHRWLERAAGWCRRFNDGKIRRLTTVELQADEIRTMVGRKEQSIWVFAVIDVWSRLWPSTVVRQTKLPKHAGPVSRSLQPNESRSAPSDYHGWVGILRESRRTSLWASLCLWPGHQDTQER